MERCSKKNIKLNQSKLQFKLKQVKFMGNIITDRGMQADPDKIAAISAMAPPRNKAGVQRFVGMANYLTLLSKPQHRYPTSHPTHQVRYPLHVGASKR